jgi:uncharacterized protein (TIGR01777 family)
MADETFTFTTQIGRPAAEVFAWHERPGALARLCPPWTTVEPLSASGGVRDGARVVLRSKLGPIWSTWSIEHRDYIAGTQFRDVQLTGPFARWEHLHLIEPLGPDACSLTDRIVYRLPGGLIGRSLGRAFVRHELERLFTWRHATTKSDLELAAPARMAGPRRVVIAGASGLLGQALIPFLQTQGHSVKVLVRRPPRNADEIQWHPETGRLDARALDEIDAVINLSGANVAGGRWTAARREQIMRSRTDAARTVVEALRQSSRKPAVLINASAIGFYGERGDEVLNETSEIGHGFLPEVCLAWETHAAAAVRAGVRTAMMRFGVVLSPKGGALGRMLPLFRCGLGGKLGHGRQWMSWISIDDAVGAIHHAMNTAHCAGPLNTVAPTPVTNAEFTATLARVLRRPAVMTVPAPVLKAAFGTLAEEALLVSTRAFPELLNASGFRFRHPDLQQALRHVLGREPAKKL